MKRLATTIALAGLALSIAACTGSGATTAPSSPASSGAAGSGDPNTLQISARNIQFSTNQLTAPADEPFKIQFENQEGAPHNVSIYNDESRSQKIFVQEPFSGPQTVTYDVPAIPAGSYIFLCDVHPDMKGTLTVQ
jgi:plastocyanin